MQIMKIERAVGSPHEKPETLFKPYIGLMTRTNIYSILITNLKSFIEIFNAFSPPEG